MTRDVTRDVAGDATAPRTAPATRGTRSTRGSRRTTGRTRRGQLGIGLVDVPAVPYRDPATAVLDNPEVAESKRFCSRCGAAVGRGQDEEPGRTDGYCTKCGTPYSFRPKLAAGDVVAGQYEVLGCLAHGGLGWIYLARDRNVSDRWVVLKGLLDAGDADAQAAAVAERRFLAEVEHPNVVRIYNFVQHADQRGGAPVGYIVMEYVGGESLREMLRVRRAADGPTAALPLPQVIAYGVECLRALGYLHGLGLLYCDFKPDNVIQTEEQVKLIDLGAVRRADDEESSVWGTVGYQAPEVTVEGPSVASDIYTVGRSLAVLSFPFDFTKRHVRELPDLADVPVLADQPSFSRLLARATDADPDRRFASADEMSTQLAGVLREVMAAADGQPRPGTSTLFTPERRTFGADLVRDPATTDLLAPPPAAALTSGLPVPLVDPADAASGLLATLAAPDPIELVRALRAAPERTVEVRLRLCRAHLESGNVEIAAALLDELDQPDAPGSGSAGLAGSGGDAGPAGLVRPAGSVGPVGLTGLEPDDWRVAYHRGLVALADDRPDAARAAFDEVYGLLPGEAAPKLALATAAERAGDLAAAACFYRLVWRTDQSYVSAAFGLARVLLRRGERAASVDVLESVPVTSSHHTAALVTAVLAATGGEPSAAALLRAGDRLAELDLDAARASRLAVEVLTAALTWVQSGGSTRGSTNGDSDPAGRTLLGVGFTERELRLGLEHRYRMLARLADRVDDRIALVDRANAIRPRTLV